MKVLIFGCRAFVGPFLALVLVAVPAWAGRGCVQPNCHLAGQAILTDSAGKLHQIEIPKAPYLHDGELRLYPGQSVLLHVADAKDGGLGAISVSRAEAAKPDGSNFLKDLNTEPGMLIVTYFQRGKGGPMELRIAHNLLNAVRYRAATDVLTAKGYLTQSAAICAVPPMKVGPETWPYLIAAVTLKDFRFATDQEKPCV